MNRPLAYALPTSWLAKSASCRGSAVEEMTKSTGKLPPPGRAGGTRAMTRTPGIFERAPETSTWSCWVVFLRSSQGLVIIPENPPFGEVI